MALTPCYALSLHDALPISKPELPSGGTRANGHADTPGDASVRSRVIRLQAMVDEQLRKLDADPHQTPMARLRRSEEHTSELQSRRDLVCRLLLEKKYIMQF